MSDKQEPKLCPYRREDSIVSGSGEVGERWTEMFAPCLQEKCAMWRVMDYVNFKTSTVEKTEIDHIEYCGLAGKIQ